MLFLQLKKILYKIYKKFIFYIINLLPTSNFFNLKRFLLISTGINIGYNTKIQTPIFLNTNLYLSIGNNTFIGSSFKILGHGHVFIGDNCDLSNEILILTGSHIIGDNLRRAGEGYTSNLIIENSCWIGARSTIISGIVIKNSSIIGACSFVNKTILENTIVAGIPAKTIRTLN
jgi:maltose O-acetyltransferase